MVTFSDLQRMKEILNSRITSLQSKTSMQFPSTSNVKKENSKTNSSKENSTRYDQFDDESVNEVQHTKCRFKLSNFHFLLKKTL